MLPAKPQKIDFLFTNFHPIITTHKYTISDRKAPNFAPIRCFLQQFAQNTPNFLIWTPSYTKGPTPCQHVNVTPLNISKIYSRNVINQSKTITSIKQHFQTCF